MTKNEFEIVDELEKEIIQPKKGGINEFIEKVKSIISVLGKGKLMEFISTKIVEIRKEIKDVIDLIKPLVEQIKEVVETVKDLKKDVEDLKKGGK